MITTEKTLKNAAADLELINIIRNENANRMESEKAFRILFNKYHDPMFFHFKNFIKDEEEAKELIMDVFQKLKKNLEKFEDEKKFSTWLFTITKNIFIDHMRKGGARTTSLTDMAVVDSDGIVEYEITSLDETPEAKMIRNERNNKLNEIIDSLRNENIKIAIKMRYFENMSYEEIAKELDIPVSSVKSYLFRGKDLLRAKCEKANINF